MSEPTLGEMRKWVDEKLTYEFSNTIYMTIDHIDFEMLRAIRALIDDVERLKKEAGECTDCPECILVTSLRNYTYGRKEG